MILATVLGGGIGLLLTVVWALTTPTGYFWAGTGDPPTRTRAGDRVVGKFFVLERPEIERRTGDSRPLAIHLGVSVLVWLYLVVQWLSLRSGLLLAGLGAARGSASSRASTRRSSSRGASTSEAIGSRPSKRPRAGAVAEQETELRRIERDLHDGAQARLVALGMSIGMAEEKLATDPEGARRLLEEARSGAREALEELRDLARGIHPAVLTDGGLARRSGRSSRARRSKSR